MSNQEYLNDMKAIQENVLNFLEDEDDERNFTYLQELLNNQKIREDKNKLRLFLRLIVAISNNHYHTHNFFRKIEQILSLFKDEIIQNHSNFEIFTIFGSNKMLTLFLIEEKIMKMDINIVKSMVSDCNCLNGRYTEYFAPEIKPFINDLIIDPYKKKRKYEEYIFDEVLKDKDEQFYENRKIGENESVLCEIIRNDSVIDFITKYNKQNFSLNTRIKTSVFETNNFLIRNRPRLIEYAAFFGAVQIIKYLFLNDIKLDSFSWLYAVHSNNAELIHFLEENQIHPIYKSYKETFEEALICHHIEVANYIQNCFADTSFNKVFESYNFAFIQNEFINKSSFCKLCKCDYYFFADMLIKNFDINVNEIYIYNNNLFNANIFILNLYLIEFLILKTFK